MQLPHRVIAHVDLDAFYAQGEALSPFCPQLSLLALQHRPRCCCDRIPSLARAPSHQPSINPTIHTQLR